MQLSSSTTRSATRSTIQSLLCLTRADHACGGQTHGLQGVDGEGAEDLVEDLDRVHHHVQLEHLLGANVVVDPPCVLRV